MVRHTNWWTTPIKSSIRCSAQVGCCCLVFFFSFFLPPFRSLCCVLTPPFIDLQFPVHGSAKSEAGVIGHSQLTII